MSLRFEETIGGSQQTFSGKVMNQLDATHMEFIQSYLAQYVSGINLPIIKSTI
jgi:hypothetical protein